MDFKIKKPQISLRLFMVPITALLETIVIISFFFALVATGSKKI